ncbi:OmpA family protein [Microbulbifer agarilyticus]|uniref:OmpA family protein n=1 Tax=Microbulbifer agarilyticus TaxID=260552 RepID=UPI001CD2EAF0|nr:OmpA family protein [Microbulbifer agarilyticus]MCA0892367.1 OmpA family protein [Microbulbifer agarilyticus]
MPFKLSSKCLSALATLTFATSAAMPLYAQETSYIDVMGVMTRVDKERYTERQGAGARATFGWQTSGNWFTEVQLFGVKVDRDSNLALYPQLDTTQVGTPTAIINSTNFNPGLAFGTVGASTSPYIYTDDLRPSGDLEFSGLGVDVVYHFSGREGYSPFVLAGIGASNNNTEYDYGPRETNGFLNVGAGIVSGPLSAQGLKVRAELRYLRDFFATDMSDYQFGIGISIPLRCPPAPAPAVAYMPPTEPEPAVEVDLDDDGDGVLNQKDRCPNTLPGARVDEYGCVIADQTITLENIQFEFNSATLTARAETSLDAVVQSLLSQPDSLIEVAGHTDSRGNDGYNLRLSAQRAESVRRYMVSRGVNPTRISARGFGETQPVASNATESGRAQNRRVELTFR